MKKLKTFGSLFMSMLSCFILGAYTVLEVRGYQHIEGFRWVATICFGIFFLYLFFERYKKENN